MNKLVIFIGSMAILSGCSMHRPMPDRITDFSPVLPQTEIADSVVDGSIYSGGANDGLFGDRKAYRVGDLITILLREKTNAIKDASGSVSRTQRNEILSPLQLARLASGSNASFPLSRDSTIDEDKDIVQEGSGAAAQSNQLGGDITVSVVRVLSNGNLVVRGEKLITLNHGDEFVQVSGVIRPDDIQPDNTILSKRLANAQITYSGEGDLNDASKLSWGNAFFLKFWPF